MADTKNQNNDIMLMIIGVQLSILGAVYEDLILLLWIAPIFTFVVYTNELRRSGRLSLNRK